MIRFKRRRFKSNISLLNSFILTELKTNGTSVLIYSNMRHKADENIFSVQDLISKLLPTAFIE